MAKFEAAPPPQGLCALTAKELVNGYARGDFTPSEVLMAVLERHEEVNPVINAVYEVAREEAQQSARAAGQRWRNREPLSSLDGVPISVKDHLHVRGLSAPRAFLFGSRAPSPADCAAAHLLREAGAILFGKTNMPELSVMPVTASTLFGETRHPSALHLSPGGSSGGAVAAILAGMGPLALASDGGGSIRIPAAFTGLVGLKPTHGRVPYFPKATDRTVAGPIGRTVADVASMMNVIARYDSRDWTALPPDGIDYENILAQEVPRQRIAVSYGFGYATVEPEIRAAVSQAAQWLASQGHQIEEREYICEDAQYTATVQAAVSTQGLLDSLSPEQRAQIAPSSIAALKTMSQLCLADYRKMQEARDRLVADLHLVHQDFDVILSPTVPHGPVELGRFFPNGEILGEDCRRIGSLTRVFNLIHQPGISVPFGHFANGLPIGVQLTAPKFQDAKLLQLAAQLEQGGSHFRPRP